MTGVPRGALARRAAIGPGTTRLFLISEPAAPGVTRQASPPEKMFFLITA